jgi:hypothetical protein
MTKQEIIDLCIYIESGNASNEDFRRLISCGYDFGWGDFEKEIAELSGYTKADVFSWRNDTQLVPQIKNQIFISYHIRIITEQMIRIEKNCIKL